MQDIPMDYESAIPDSLKKAFVAYWGAVHQFVTESGPESEVLANDLPLVVETDDEFLIIPRGSLHAAAQMFVATNAAISNSWLLVASSIILAMSMLRGSAIKPIDPSDQRAIALAALINDRSACTVKQLSTRTGVSEPEVEEACEKLRALEIVIYDGDAYVFCDLHVSVRAFERILKKWR